MIHCGAPCRGNLKEEDRKSSRDLPSPGASCAFASILAGLWLDPYICEPDWEFVPHQPRSSSPSMAFTLMGTSKLADRFQHARAGPWR